MHSHRMSKVIHKLPHRISGGLLRLLIVIAFGYPVNQAMAQPGRDNYIREQIKELTGIWTEYENKLAPWETSDNLSAIPELFSVKPDTAKDSTTRNAYLAEAALAREQMLKRFNGLEAYGSYMENFSSNFIDPESNLFFRRKFSAGLEWNALGANGFYENLQRRKILKNQAEIYKLQKQLGRISYNFLDVSYFIIYHFNKYKLQTLEKRREMLRKNYEIAENLFLMKHVTKQDLMQIIQKQAEVENMLALYKGYNDLLDTLGYNMTDKALLPMFDINVMKYVRDSSGSVQQGYLDSAVYELAVKNLKLEHAYWNLVGLKTYARYNYFDLANQSVSAQFSNRNYFSVGLNVNFPLYFPGKRKINFIEAQARAQAYKPPVVNQDQQRDFINRYYEFRYKVKQFYGLVEKRKYWSELIRAERVKKDVDELMFNPVRAMFLIDDLYAIDIEMLDTRQNMYIDLLNFQVRAPQLKVEDCVTQLTAPVISKERRNKAFRVNPGALDLFTPGALLEYALLNDMNEIIIPFDDKTSAKTEAVISSPSFASVDVWLSTGIDKISQATALLMKKANSTRKTGLFLKLSDGQTIPSQGVDSLTVFVVSVPWNTSAESLKALTDKCSAVYLEVPAGTGKDAIVSKTSGLDEDLKFQLGLSIQTDAFKTRTELEAFTRDITKASGIQRVIQGDFEGLRKLDGLSYKTNIN